MIRKKDFMFITSQQYSFKNFANENEKLKKFKRKTMRFVFENDEKMNINQKQIINTLRLIKNVMKITLTLIKFVLVDANDDESAIKRKRFNKLQRFILSIKRFILFALKRFVFSIFKIESKDSFIFKNLLTSQSISDNAESDDDFLTLFKKFTITISIALILNNAKIYAKENRNHLRIIYDISKILKNEKNLNLVI